MTHDHEFHLSVVVVVRWQRVPVALQHVCACIIMPKPIGTLWWWWLQCARRWMVHSASPADARPSQSVSPSHPHNCIITTCRRAEPLARVPLAAGAVVHACMPPTAMHGAHLHCLRCNIPPRLDAKRQACARCQQQQMRLQQTAMNPYMVSSVKSWENGCARELQGIHSQLKLILCLDGPHRHAQGA